MGKARKSVRKFAQKHLKATIAHRHKVKPMKNAIRKKEAALEDKRFKARKDQDEQQASKKKLQDLNADELMSGGFEDEEDELEDVSAGAEESDDDSLPEVEGEENCDFVDITPKDLADEDSESDDDEEGLRAENKKFKSEIEKHKLELAKLKEKDPSFYEFLKEHDEELLDFGGDDDEEAAEDSEKDVEMEDRGEAGGASVLTTSLVDSWCLAVKEKANLRSVRNLLAAYRSACHYGEGDGESLSEEFNITNSHVFNKIMVFMLTEIDGAFKRMLELPTGKIITVQDLHKASRWRNLLPFVKSYLGNTLHILNQMTDNRMLAFTLRHLRPSIIFLGDCPALARKYVKAVLHFWATGEGALPFVAFTFLRDVVLQLGTDYMETCSKGIYKQYVSNTKFINATSLPRAQFMANCVVELYGLDTGVAYQNAFSFIRQIAIILRSAVTVKTKDAFRKVYCWQYIASLELWVKVVSAYNKKDTLGPLAYPLAQIITGVARLVPTARYFPLRMQCAILLNKLAAATETFVPVASLLLDMLEFKELRKPPTGGVGRATDFQILLKVPKPTVKTRAFQEECVTTVLEQLTEHLTQWSYAVAFPELALVPLVQLRRFMKQTSVDRFRRQAKQLVDQIERNVEFVTKKRNGVAFSPKDSEAVLSFLKEEKEADATSPLSQYCKILRQKTKERKEALAQSNVTVKQHVKPVRAEETSTEEDTSAKELFNKNWLDEKKNAGSKQASDAAKEQNDQTDEDVVEDLFLSSDEEDENEEEEATEEQGVHSSDDEDMEQQAAAANGKKRDQHKGAKSNNRNKRKQAPEKKPRSKSFAKRSKKHHI